MYSLALLCSVLLADTSDTPAPGPATAPAAAVLDEYDALRAKVSRDASAHVKLALWCEAHDLGPERVKHLALAVLIDPKNATARGLMGLMAYRNRWERPEQVSARIRADEALNPRQAEYHARREKLVGPLDDLAARGGPRAARTAAAAHLALGLWCEKNGLNAEAKAHFTSAVVRDPYNDAAWLKLGYLKHDGRWMSIEQVTSEQREADVQKRADRRWEPLLKKWRGWLAGDDPDKKQEARALLADVVDPHAVPAVVRVFRDGKEPHELLAVQLLGQIDAPTATRALAALAVLDEATTVRFAAIEVLRGRPPLDFVGMLVDQIHAPMRYQVEPVRGPGSPGALLIETPRYKMLRTYDAPPVFQPGANFFGYVGYDPNGMPIVASGKEMRRLSMEWNVPGLNSNFVAIEQRTLGLIAQANLKATASLQQLISDVHAIEQSNAQTTRLNGQIVSTLQSAVDAPTSLDSGNEDGWHKWWYDRLGYRYDAPDQVQVAVSAAPQYPAPSIRSCFVAGTPVKTLDGLRPIEVLQVGDKVLSQDTTTGALTFQPIQVVHHNPPGSTVQLTLDNGETLVPSVYHRFWRAGRGWAIARDLRPGDVLRTLEGLARIDAIAAGPVEALYNLDVAESRTFFVGAHSALVHDNTLPAARSMPFDAAAVTVTGPSETSTRN
jgi:hypothetical protein